jgi:hypothetical protein
MEIFSMSMLAPITGLIAEGVRLFENRRSIKKLDDALAQINLDREILNNHARSIEALHRAMQDLAAESRAFKRWLCGIIILNAILAIVLVGLM